MPCKYKKTDSILYSLHYISIFIMLFMMLVACTNDTVNMEEPIPQGNPTEASSPPLSESSLTPSKVPEPSPTIPPTSSSTPVPLPTHVYPTPSLPALSGNDFFFGDFFFEDAFDTNCSLPCWRGLRIDQSTDHDVLQVFESLFGPADYSNAGLGAFGVDAPIQDIYTRGFHLIGAVGDFYASAAFHDETDKLQFLGFAWSTTDTSVFEIHLSPQTVIQQLGSPAYMFANQGPILEQITLLILYEEGIGFLYFSEMIDFDEESRRYCFATTEHQIANSLTFGNLYILEPFDYGLDDLSPMQDATVGQSIRWHNLQPFEDLFNVSQDDVIERIMQEENTCVDY